jgi:hypothetical protein
MASSSCLQFNGPRHEDEPCRPKDSVDEIFCSRESFRQFATSSGGDDRNVRRMEDVMKLTVVRYRTKPETANENERLIRAVFQELRAKSRDDVRYLALRLGDGTFIHVSIAETEDGASPIPQLEAFRLFQPGLKERCVEPLQQTEATIAGNYRMFGEA